MIQLDVTSAETERLSEIWGLSPDEKTVAMWQGENDLILWNLDKGEAERVPIMWNPGEGDRRTEKAGLCSVAWSPDSQQLAYVQASCPQPSSTLMFFVIHVDLSGMEQRLLRTLQGYFSVDIQWETASQIKLRGCRLTDYKKWALDFDDWVLDPVTGELESVP